VRDDRVDPVEILARVGGVSAENPERAYQVWVHKARKAGWTVVEEPGYHDATEGTLCGTVSIEGLRYRVHYGLRVRSMLVELTESSTAHVIEQAVAVVGGAPVRRFPIFAHAAWVEPDLGGEAGESPRQTDVAS
jgi:hypothetical protein